jgi:hypothetical protein
MPHETARLEEAHQAERERARAALKLTGDRRDEVARILEIVAKDGLHHPRDLDVALDAIESAYLSIDNGE